MNISLCSLAPAVSTEVEIAHILDVMIDERHFILHRVLLLWKEGSCIFYSFVFILASCVVSFYLAGQLLLLLIELQRDLF